MVGREMTATFPPGNAVIGDAALELRNLTGNGVKNISFKAHRGEVLGISGLVGAGRTGIMKVVCGAEKISRGGVVNSRVEAEIADFNGKAMRIKAPDLKNTRVMTLSGGNQQSETKPQDTRRESFPPAGVSACRVITDQNTKPKCGEKKSSSLRKKTNCGMLK